MSGDFGPWTIYTTARRKRVFFARAPPTTGPSPAQYRCRQRFALSIRLFKLLPHATQVAWESLCKQANIVATGLDLWIHLSLTADRDGWTELVHRTGTTLTPPVYLPR